MKKIQYLLCILLMSMLLGNIYIYVSLQQESPDESVLVTLLAACLEHLNVFKCADILLWWNKVRMCAFQCYIARSTGGRKTRYRNMKWWRSVLRSASTIGWHMVLLLFHRTWNFQKAREEICFDFLSETKHYIYLW